MQQIFLFNFGLQPTHTHTHKYICVCVCISFTEPYLYWIITQMSRHCPLMMFPLPPCFPVGPCRLPAGTPGVLVLRGLRSHHLGPLPAEGGRSLLARGMPAVRRLPAAARRHLLLQRHQTVLQERLPAVRPPAQALRWALGLSSSARPPTEPISSAALDIQ